MALDEKDIRELKIFFFTGIGLYLGLLAYNGLNQAYDCSQLTQLSSEAYNFCSSYKSFALRQSIANGLLSAVSLGYAGKTLLQAWKDQ